MRNWAGNHTYAARRVLEPRSVAELQEVLAGAKRVRAVGSRHSFTDLADTTGDLVSTAGLPRDIDVDAVPRVVRVGAGVRYGELA